MWGTTQKTSQDGFQVLILLIAVVCIPTMLLVKPIHMIKKMNKKHQKGRRAKENSDELGEQF